MATGSEGTMRPGSRGRASLLAILVIGGVIFPAVWSSKRARRAAALNVLDRILRWRR